ncbi:MAG: NAD(P)-dependent oxidoreductase [Promethearchaeota archaeon]
MKAFVTSELNKEAMDALERLLGGEVVYENWRSTGNLYFDDEALIKRINDLDADVLICEGDNVKHEVIVNTDLKIICSTRDDPNNIDVETASSKGIPVLFAPKRNTESVAELTVALMLALARNLHVIDRTLHSGEYSVEEFTDYVRYYNQFKGFELNGKNVGIIGLGAIGYRVARLLVPFNVNLLVFDPYVSKTRLVSVGGTGVSLNELLAGSDIITVHCPPTDETDGMIGEGEIALMKPSACFLNLGRASVTDEDALLRALQEKRIACAALDVFSLEPVDQENEFLQLDNVIVTPHIGGDTVDTNDRHGMMMVRGIEMILNGKVPPNIKNPEVLTSFSGDAPRGHVNLIDMRLEIIDACKKMVEKGFVVGTAGNVSTRVKRSGGEDQFLVTPSTVDYEHMEPGDVVLVDEGGNTIEGRRNPTSERRMHIAIFKARPDVNAIIHTHAPFSTALSIAKVPIGPFVDEFIPFVGGCDVAEFGLAGSKELARNVVDALGDNYAVFIANHGNVCCGTSMEHAWMICKMVEQAAMTQFYASMFGTMYALPEDAEEEEKEIFDVMKSANESE